MEGVKSRIGGRGAGFLASVFVLGVVAAPVLGRVVEFAAGSDLQSHIILIPFVSAYLAWLKRGAIPKDIKPGWPLGVVLTLIGSFAMIVHHVLGSRGLLAGTQDGLVLPMFAFVAGLAALVAFFFGGEAVRVLRFPLVFMFFAVPVPEPLAHGLREGLQRLSAEAAYGMFVLAGTPVFRDGLVFHLSGLSVEVAEECSGIHSSLVLLIASFIAAHLFLRRTWGRAVLICAVIPLGILRNGFRVVSLSLLTIHVDPGIIDSPLHHRGGPIFFVLSLVVLLGLLWLLRRMEAKTTGRSNERTQGQECPR